MKTLISCLVVLFAGLSANASDEIGFDAIVSDLEGVTSSPLDEPNPFDAVKIYGSVGIVGSYNHIRVPNQATTSGLLNGFEARFGIDLFSPFWQAQGAIRSFDRSKIDSNLSVSLKEFDLSILHSGNLNRRLRWHLGGGVAARYLKVFQSQSGEVNYSTPSSVLATGLKVRFTERVGLTTDISWRRAFIDDSADRTGYQASLSLDAQF